MVQDSQTFENLRAQIAEKTFQFPHLQKRACVTSVKMMIFWSRAGHLLIVDEKELVRIWVVIEGHHDSWCT